MSRCTITLTGEGLDSLRTGTIAVRTRDSLDREVVLYPQGAWKPPMYRPGGLAAVLSDADLDLIEHDPVGLVVGDATRTTGWMISMEAAR